MNYALTPRPELAPAELAAVVAASEALLRRGERPEVDEVPRWRFSGRWFNAERYASRRPQRLT